MIAVTKRAFGVTLSLMMSVSMAAPAMSATTDKGKEHGKTYRTSAVSNAIAPTRTRAAAKSATKASPSAGHHMTYSRARVRDIPSHSGRSNDRIIRRASLSGHVDRKLIDDGTLWHEEGSHTTWQQTGMASWYGGKRWQGHATSSGAAFDENALTAAHATLPLGTKVRVVTHDGSRSVIVTINDRPGTRSRIIDLSREAAKQLGILEAGVAMVTLQPM